MKQIETIAIGLELRLVPTSEGGRQTALRGGCEQEHRFTYRPNWGLPGWSDSEQTGAPILGFSRVDIRPGDTVLAIAVPPFGVPDWKTVAVGDALRMYEGARACGHGTVCWLAPATWPMPLGEQKRLARWLAE